MEVIINEVGPEQPETVTISCRRIDERVRDIADFINSRQGKLTGILDGSEYAVPVAEIYYAETVDSRCFLYCGEKVYEAKQRLYELEQYLSTKGFLRVSKSVLLNLMKVESIKPSINGRFIASLKNGERVVISRKYVSLFRETLREGM